MKRRIRRWTRDLHLYVGLFVSPFVVLFALSVIFLNHAWLPWGGLPRAEVERRTVDVSVDAVDDNLELAREIQGQIGVRGEIDFISRNPRRGSVSFPIRRPGAQTDVRVDLAAGRAELATRRTGVWDAAVHLHKMPGPHNQSVRGNWVFTRIWGWLADATVYLLLFVTVTGIYLWVTLRSERRGGLLAMGAGLLSFVVLVVAIAG